MVSTIGTIGKTRDALGLTREAIGLTQNATSQNRQPYRAREPNIFVAILITGATITQAIIHMITRTIFLITEEARLTKILGAETITIQNTIIVTTLTTEAFS